MFKAKQKTVSLVVACLTMLLTVLFAFAMLFAPTPIRTASAATTEIVFELGANGSASHSDGTSKSSYTETVSGYTLELTGGTQMYTGARDAKGNSCIKLGSSKNTGSFSLTAPNDVEKVIFAVAQYKANTTKIQVNKGAVQSITTASNNGEYTNIEVDTSTTKNITFASASGGIRAMVNTITFIVPSSEGACTHENEKEEITTAATCTTAGEKTFTCNDCGTVRTEVIPALGHSYDEGTVTQEATCTTAGSETFVCTTCGAEDTQEIPAKGHNYVGDSCSVCGEAKPSTLTLTFDNTEKRTEFSTSKQVWVENGITVTNNKANSTNDVGNYSNPARFYKSSELIVESAGMTKIEFTCNTADYATALENSITDATVTVTVEASLVTVVFAAPVDSFTITLSGGQVRMNSITVHIVTAESEICEHENKSTSTVGATCTENGSITVTCDDCGATISTEEITALGHSYTDGYCSVCHEQDPATIDYSGDYYLSFTHSETVYYADNSELNSNRYYARTEAPALDAITTKYVYRLTKTATSIYSLYEFDGDLYQDNITVKKEGDAFRFYATVDEEKCQFLLNADSSTKYIKFYKASNAGKTNYAQDITLTPVELNVNIDSANITIGADLTLNYYVTMDEIFEGAKMYISINDGEEEEYSYTTDGGRYKFSLEVPPQCMTDVIKATLKSNGLVLDTVEYSIQKYAQNQLNNLPNEKLKQLLTDMLYYGAAAQNYKDYNTSKLATDDVENLGTESTAAPTTSDFSLTAATSEAYFKSATVFFNDVNQIFVRISTTENVTVKAYCNETEITVEVDGTTIKTDGISATGFADTYKFELSHNGTLVQTLTYSVNAYAYRMQNHESMGELALALYRYGVSATAYAG